MDKRKKACPWYLFQRSKRGKAQTSKVQRLVNEDMEEVIPGISLYYPRTPPEIPDFKRKFKAASNYLKCKGYTSKNKVAVVEDDEYFALRFELIVANSAFNEQWPEFANELVEDPVEVLSLWGLAMHKIVDDLKKSEQLAEVEDVEDDEGVPSRHPPYTKIMAGIMKNEPVTPLFDIKSSLIGKFVTVRGAVIRMANCRPYVTHMTFECKTCGASTSFEQPDGKIIFPSRCDECDSFGFMTVEEAMTTRLITSRMIRIQDTNYSQMEPGSVPRSIECELFGSMVGRCDVGDALSLSGIVKMIKDDGGPEKSLHKIYVEVVSLKNHKDSERTMGGHWFSFSNRDYYAIKEIHDTKEAFRLLVASICPSIYGHTIVKAALLLSLLGGTSRGDNIISRRSDINMLIVGEPGIGKSQMLKFIAETAPKGLYVCGNGSTAAGLTVTLVREGNDYAIEAGALVMADRGCCCIDEFDKMSSLHNSLLEAMEQQSISIAKAGAHRTIPARTTVIAAANPVDGQYDKRKSVNGNIRMSAALLSRFDLTFILLDTPNQDFDKRVVEHILGGQMNASHAAQNEAQGRERTFEGYVSLSEKLQWRPGEEVDIIPQILLRNYIAYAKQYVKPSVSNEAAAVLKKYYLNLRNKHRFIDSTPVTARQLEALIRLTEARAKAELREVATADDARDVLEIWESGLAGALEDDVIVTSDLPHLGFGSSSAAAKANGTNAKKLLLRLHQTAERCNKNIFSSEEIRHAAAALGLVYVVEALVVILNKEGYLIKKGPRVYQVQPFDF